LFFPHIYAENAPVKSSKGSQKNPNKKKNKKATLAEKRAADAVRQHHAAAVAPPSPPPSPTANRRRRVAFRVVDPNVVSIASQNPFDVLLLQDSGHASPNAAPSPVASPKKEAYHGCFFDAITAFGDFEYTNFDEGMAVSVEAPASQLDVVGGSRRGDVDAATEQHTEERPRRGFFSWACKAVGRVIANVAAAAVTIINIARSCF